jgi:hypothetical protein
VSHYGGEQAPLPRHALELVHAAVIERDLRARDEVLDRARDEHFACLRLRGDPSTHIYGETRDLLSPDLTLTGVDTAAHFDSKVADRLADGDSTSNRASGAVEGSEEAVARCIELAPPELVEQPANDGVVVLERLAPAPVAEPRRLLGGADDVGEEHRREHSVGLRVADGSCEELFDLRESPLDAPDEQRGATRDFDPLCERNSPGHVLGIRPHRRSVEDEHRDTDRGEDSSNVDVHCHAMGRERSAGACPAAQRLAVPLERGLVVELGRPCVGELLL